MAKSRHLRVLVATDGSAQARAAMATAVDFPWPVGTRARAIVARRTGAEYRRSVLLAALDRAAEQAASGARRALARRWPDVEVVVVDKAPVDAIVAEAERSAADVIVLGWRGHGAARRLLMGSVSRGVVRRASAAVLVTRRRRRRISRIVIGFDDSPAAAAAVELVGQLPPPPGGRVTLVTTMTLVSVPKRGLVARTVAADVRHSNATRRDAAEQKLKRAAATLRRKGWLTRTVLTTGEALRDLLRTVAKERAHVLVVGARGSSGVRYLLLGSVAEGALNHAPVPVLVARRGRT